MFFNRVYTYLYLSVLSYTYVEELKTTVTKQQNLANFLFSKKQDVIY